MLLARPKNDEQVSIPVEIISERELAELAREPVDTKAREATKTSLSRSNGEPIQESQRIL